MEACKMRRLYIPVNNRTRLIVSNALDEILVHDWYS
jgi:hypothetical protein